jgi:isopenicillin-N epimerase
VKDLDWALDPTVKHLNHGAYGGCPTAVLEKSFEIKRRLESSPMRFFGLEWQAKLDHARAVLGNHVGADPSCLAFVPNATSGVAIALASCELAAGDEILTTNHSYRACRNQLERRAREVGARVVIVEIPLPFDPSQAIEAIAAGITARTKIALIDDITSPTAVIMPLREIIAKLAGVQVIVDGAHAPGTYPLEIDKHRVAFYTGNCHKWLCAPKACGFIVSREAFARPIVTSHGASPDYGPSNRMHAELDWAGTYDPSSQLSVPTAIETLAGVGTPHQIFARNHALVLALRDLVIDGLGGDKRHHLAPDSSLGVMAAIPIQLPPNTTPLEMTQRLLREGWELPIVAWPGQPLVRISAHLYNSIEDGPPLVEKLRALKISL